MDQSFLRLWKWMVSALLLRLQEEEEEQRVKVLNFTRKGVLILLEIVLSILLYSPELIEGSLRLVRAVWAQVIDNVESSLPNRQRHREHSMHSKAHETSVVSRIREASPGKYDKSNVAQHFWLELMLLRIYGTVQKMPSLLLTSILEMVDNL
eukprot:4379991-Amphidinium_carterae.1